MKNILFMHGGGPTAVINASLSGSIRELYDRSFDGDILYAPFGTGGLLKNKINRNNASGESGQFYSTIIKCIFL